MTPKQVEGRRITFVIACWGCLPSVTIFLMNPHESARIPDSALLFRFLAPLVVSVFLLRRKAWARYLLVVLFALAASVTPVHMLLEGRDSWLNYFIGGLASVVHAVAATTLYASKSVEAFFRGEDREAP